MSDSKFISDNEIEQLVNCNKLNSTKKFDEEAHNGELSIENLLQNKFNKHLGAFELPDSIKNIMTVDDVNAIITWYLHWQLTSPVSEQTTCTIINIFGKFEGTKVIVAINFFKYLRNKSYDPTIVEMFEKNKNI
jgi:hypothetical protein